MSAEVFQVLNGSEPVDARGIPGWIFWLMLIVILILIVFILIRDRRVREKISKFFSWFFHKIRVARLKSRINRLGQQKTGLLSELGRTVWEKNSPLTGIDQEKQEIGKLKRDEGDLKGEIEQLDRDIEKWKREADDIDRDHQARMGEEEKKKSPLDRRYRDFEKTYRSLQDQIKDREKLQQKLLKSIPQHHRDNEKIQKDGYLSKIEKETKQKNLEKEIRDIQKQEKQVETEIGSLKQKGERLNREMQELKKEISVFAETIDRLKTENHSYHKKNDETVEKLQKSRKALGIKKIGLQKQLALAFEKVGEKANQSRIESQDLKPLFDEIDKLESQVRDLEDRMQKS